MFKSSKVQPLDLRSSLLTLMFIDLERDSAIRVQALMALTAYSVRQNGNKFPSALAYPQP